MLVVCGMMVDINRNSGWRFEFEVSVVVCRIGSSACSAFAKIKGVILSVDPLKCLRITALSLQLEKVSFQLQ